MKNTKTIKGITLVALIITIIIMLILAAVSITSINQGLFDYAKTATKDTAIASMVEKFSMDGIISENPNLNGTASEIFGSDYEKYDSTFRVENGKLIYSGDDIDVINYLFSMGLDETNMENGAAVCVILGHDFKPANYLNPKTCKRCGAKEGTKLTATAPHPEQSTENTDIGIGTDGELVNLDNWNYEIKSSYCILKEYWDIFNSWWRDRWNNSTANK